MEQERAAPDGVLMLSVTLPQQPREVHLEGTHAYGTLRHLYANILQHDLPTMKSITLFFMVYIIICIHTHHTLTSTSSVAVRALSFSNMLLSSSSRRSWSGVPPMTWSVTLGRHQSSCWLASCRNHSLSSWWYPGRSAEKKCENRPSISSRTYNVQTYTQAHIHTYISH